MTKINRKDKWRNVSLTPDNIDEYMVDLINDNNGRYVTQGVSFNKKDAFHMGMLRQALLNHSSFSGLVKHLLALYLSGQPLTNNQPVQQYMSIPEFVMPVQPEPEPEPETTIKQTPTPRPVVIEKPKPISPKPESSPVQKPTKRRGGGAFLTANPNAKPPKD